MGDHEAPKEKDGGLRELLSSKEALRPLIEDCRKGRISRAVARREARDPRLTAAYDSPLDHAQEFARRLAYLSVREAMRFKKALGLLRSNKEGGVRALTKGGMDVKGEGVYEALLLQSWMLRYDSPQLMCHLARVAVEMCDGFDPKVYSAKRVADLRARAWGELANAYRVADRLREAETAFGEAFLFFRQGSGDRELKLRLFDLEASLLGTLREFELALDRLGTLSRMYREAGDLHLAGRTLITQALYTYYQGDTPSACSTIAEGLRLIDPDRDPSLVLVSTFNQLLFFVDAGLYPEAKKALFENRPRFTAQGRIAMIKLRGIEGCIDYGTGNLESAETAFREEKAGFIEAEMDFHRAIATLELATTLLRRGKTDESIKEGLESAELFLSLNVQREIRGTALFLQDAFEQKTMQLETLEKTLRWLRKKMVEYGVG